MSPLSGLKWQLQFNFGNKPPYGKSSLRSPRITLRTLREINPFLYADKKFQVVPLKFFATY